MIDVVSLIALMGILLGAVLVTAFAVPAIVAVVWRIPFIRRLAFPFIDEVERSSKAFNKEMNREETQGKPATEAKIKRQGDCVRGYSMVSAATIFGMLFLMAHIINDIVQVIIEKLPKNFFERLIP